MNHPGEPTATPNQGRPGGGFLDRLRIAAQFAVIVGAAGSVGLTLRAGRRSPRLLMALFVVWVLAPFVALAWANVVSKRWSDLTRATLSCLTLALTLGSLASYGAAVWTAAGSPRTFVFVLVAPGSWLLMATVVPIAAFVSGRRSRRGAGA